MKYLIIFLLLIMISSCYYDNEEYLYPYEEKCDTTYVTYRINIKPIITNYCDFCHSISKAQAMGGGIELETYDQIYKRAKDGTLLGSVSYQKDYSPMPPIHKLDECEVAAIRIWIKLGYKEN